MKQIVRSLLSQAERPSYQQSADRISWVANLSEKKFRRMVDAAIVYNRSRREEILAAKLMDQWEEIGNQVEYDKALRLYGRAVIVCLHDYSALQKSCDCDLDHILYMIELCQ